MDRDLDDAAAKGTKKRPTAAVEDSDEERCFEEDLRTKVIKENFWGEYSQETREVLQRRRVVMARAAAAIAHSVKSREDFARRYYHHTPPSNTN